MPADRDEAVKDALSEVYARMHGMFTSSTGSDTSLLLELLAAKGYAVVPTEAVQPLTPVDDASVGRGLGAPRERMTP